MMRSYRACRCRLDDRRPHRYRLMSPPWSKRSNWCDSVRRVKRLRLRHRSATRWRKSSSNGRSCVTPTAKPDSSVTLAFVRTNPNWPSIRLLRRRAEARLWQERRDATTVRRFVGAEPTSTVGRLSLARVLTGEGDRVNAEREVRAVWRVGGNVG